MVRKLFTYRLFFILLTFLMVLWGVLFIRSEREPLECSTVLSYYLNKGEGNEVLINTVAKLYLNTNGNGTLTFKGAVSSVESTTRVDRSSKFLWYNSGNGHDIFFKDIMNLREKSDNTPDHNLISLFKEGGGMNISLSKVSTSTWIVSDGVFPIFICRSNSF